MPQSLDHKLSHEVLNLEKSLYQDTETLYHLLKEPINKHQPAITLRLGEIFTKHTELQALLELHYNKSLRNAFQPLLLSWDFLYQRMKEVIMHNQYHPKLAQAFTYYQEEHTKILIYMTLKLTPKLP